MSSAFVRDISCDLLRAPDSRPEHHFLLKLHEVWDNSEVRLPTEFSIREENEEPFGATISDARARSTQG